MISDSNFGYLYDIDCNRLTANSLHDSYYACSKKLVVAEKRRATREREKRSRDKKFQVFHLSRTKDR